MFDKGRQIGGTGQREPAHGLTVGAGDGGEGAPFVDGEVVFGELFRVGVKERERKREEKRRG
jgi:hypothetical protein